MAKWDKKKLNGQKWDKKIKWQKWDKKIKWQNGIK